MNNSKAIGEELEHYMERTGVLSRELADLKALVRDIKELCETRKYYTKIYYEGEIQITYIGKVRAVDGAIDEKLKQAVTLANTDSKEER